LVGPTLDTSLRASQRRQAPRVFQRAGRCGLTPAGSLHSAAAILGIPPAVAIAVAARARTRILIRLVPATAAVPPHVVALASIHLALVVVHGISVAAPVTGAGWLVWHLALG
jgi:hypothetical protein